MNLLATRMPLLVPSLLLLLPWTHPLAGSTQDTIQLVYDVPANESVELFLRQQVASVMESSTWYPVVGGVIVEEDEFAFEMEEELTVDLDITLTDRFGALDDDGALASLERTFETLDAAVRRTSTLDGEETSEEPEYVSPLIGEVVLFERDATDGSYRASFANGDEREASDFDEALLASQKVDAFGDWYLPGADESTVEIGATWDAGVDAWHRTLDAGGDFWIGPWATQTPSEETVEARRAGRAQQRSGGDGEVICTYTGEREVDGRTLAVIQISVDVAVESTTSMEATAESNAGEEEFTTTTSAELHWTGEGEFLWDSETHAPSSLSLEMHLVSTDETVTIPSADANGDGNAWRTERHSDATILYTFKKKP